jgi:AcrR family transcriptional regulator
MPARAVPESYPDRPTTLNRTRVLVAAVALADREGLETVSMRKLGQEVGLEAMSLYTHVRGKDDLLGGMIEVVLREIDVAPAGPDWQASLRRTVLGARAVILRHPWAPRLIETRATPGPEMLRYLDGVIGILRGGGLSLDLTHHALHVLGSRLLGFTQDLFDDAREPDPSVTAAFAAQIAATYPFVAEMAVAVSHDGGLGGCDDDTEFEIALDLILGGLERLRDR